MLTPTYGYTSSSAVAKRPRDASYLSVVSFIASTVQYVERSFLLSYGHSYHRRRIGNNIQAFEWYQFGWPSVIYNRDFKVTIIQRQITRKWYDIELCLQWPTNRKSHMIYRTAPFSMTLNDPYSRFQGHSIFDAEYLRNGTIYRHSFNGILIGTYTRPTQQCRFEWPWVT